MPTNATVQITYNGGADPPQLTLSPVSAEILGAATVTFDSNCPVTVTFAVQNGLQGPFPSQNNASNPSEGVYIVSGSGGGKVTTAVASMNTNGTWAYTATTTNRGTPSGNGDVVVRDNP